MDWSHRAQPYPKHLPFRKNSVTSGNGRGFPKVPPIAYIRGTCPATPPVGKFGRLRMTILSRRGASFRLAGRETGWAGPVSDARAPRCAPLVRRFGLIAGGVLG